MKTPEQMLEKEIEERVCEYAKKNGVLAYKFNSMNRASVPDRLFIDTTGYMWFCEFKRRGQTPTPAQTREHVRLQNSNVTVFVIDNVVDGKLMIDTHGNKEYFLKYLGRGIEC